MSDAPLFYAVPATGFRIGQDASLVLTADREVIRVDALAARVFGASQGCRTLEGHAALAGRAVGPSDRAAVAAALNRLVHAGLLRPMPFLPTRQPAPVPARDIDTVALVTADRPDLLLRALESLLAHTAGVGRAPRVLVVDGSRQRAVETEAQVQHLRARTNARLEYAGAKDAAALRQYLAAEGVPQRTLETLTPGPIGANRNLAVLLTAGERVLMIDDDVLCDVWAAAGATPDLVVAGHVDLRQWRFFPTRQAALRGLERVERDLLAAHGEWLGQTLQGGIDASGRMPDLEHACGHMASAAATRSERVVRVTMAGLAGDSARYCPHRLLFTPGAVRDLFRTDPASLDCALTSREVRNIALRPTLMHEPVCMSYCMGLDNTAVVPPFMPEGRGEDTVFGAMLGFIAPSTLFAHLACGIVHDSTRPSSWADPMPSARQTRVSEVLVAQLAAHPSVAAGGAEARLRHAGRTLGELGRVAPDEFATIAGRTALHTRAAQIAALESLIATPAFHHARWRAAHEAYRRTFELAALEPGFAVPIEFRDDDDVASGLGRTQTFIGQFGALMEQWPDIWALAARRRLAMSQA